ncbi:hypothetical protein OF83DRAFT_1175581 [Amylostereum chailletii]|nr:hypothetical protein OF83DRAFT_1175581 [Amylostereum chailletii]
MSSSSHSPILVSSRPVYPFAYQLIPALSKTTTASPNVMTDGYISYTFSPRGADYFFKFLLKVRSVRELRVALEYNRFLVYNQPSVLPPPISMDAYQRPRWLLDFIAETARGTVVPQEIWMPQAPQDHQRHIADANLQMPIFFMQLNGAVGIPLRLAASRTTNGSLAGGTYPALMGGRVTTHFCLKWLGYSEFRRQIELQAHGVPLTIERLVHKIGSFVDAFVQESANAPSSYPQWRVGTHPTVITRENITIMGLVHVSAGTWMPILQLNRHIV